MSLRDDFLLDPDVTFLNHGSFGACPRPVFETYQRWQLESERQPVEFYGRRYDGLIDEARAILAAYVNVPASTLIFQPNATVAMNMVARSLTLQVGDEILTTDHEYGAMDLMWNFITKKTGATYRAVPVPTPIKSAEQWVQGFLDAITPQTKVIFLSHITSPTAITFPIEPVVRTARERGILTIVDGAHAVGQIPLDLTALGADIYTSNCHKWLCAPKGTAFLYVREEVQPLLDPLVISWGYVPSSDFAFQNQWQGTRDIAAYLSVPAAIEYHRANDWDAVRARCHALAKETRARLVQILGTQALTPDDDNWYQQMIALPLPPIKDPLVFKRRLYDEFRVEIPISSRGTQHYIRASYQAYNTPDDMERLLAAVENVLGEERL